MKFKLIHAFIDEEYRKKWNIGEQDDFLHVYVDGVKVNNTLYRKGRIGSIIKDGYIDLMKHVEAYYPDSITKILKDKPHLEDHWCIISVKDGVEKVVLDHFRYLTHQGGVIYSSDSKYYNIETGELYCQSYSSMSSLNYIFLENKYDDDKSKRGVLKIDKYKGTYELFS